SVAFYALMTGDDMEADNAEHYLVQAAALDESQPELWYLMGRVHEQAGKLEEAADNYRRQLKDHPGTESTRLATNALANVLLDAHAGAPLLQQALASLEAEIARTPGEAALHDTKGRLLAAMGRKSEAIAEYETAFRISGDAETGLALKKLREGT